MIECYECRGELFFIEAVWVNPLTGEATTGDGGEAFHVECAPAQRSEPTCGICGRGEDDSPNILPKMRPFEADWNGDTGNHRLCEEVR